MFKFIEAAQQCGVEVIPFSVQNSMNAPSEYSKYFAKPRSKQLLYADTRFTISNIWGMIRATVWNYDALRKLRKLIQEVKPDAIYILHEVNHLSPSIIRAAKKENIRVVHRISDFFMLCARYDFLANGEICEACINGVYTEALRKKCVKNSTFGTLLRIVAMKLYKATKVFDDVDCFVTTCDFSKQKLIQGGMEEKNKVCSNIY